MNTGTNMLGKAEDTDSVGLDAEGKASGQPLPAPSSEPQGLPRWNIPGYRFLAPIHRGGMGAVYLALQLSMDRKVAIKVLAPSLAHDSQYVKRFEREAKACASISHPNIVAVYDVGMVDARPYLVMEFIDGIDLARRIRARPLSVREVLSLGIAVAAGLEHAHKNSIVHRDIKPGNVLIARDGSVKLTDLGLAKNIDENEGSLTMDGTCMGSPSYMPPEQARYFKDAGPPADVYGLGATLYHALYGRAPFEGDNTLDILQKVLRDPPQFPEREDVPAVVVELLRCTLAKDPAQRYPDGAALLRALRLAVAGKPAPALQTAAAVPTHRKTARKLRKPRPRKGPPWAGLAIGAAILVVLAALVIFADRKTEPDPEPTAAQIEAREQEQAAARRAAAAELLEQERATLLQGIEAAITEGQLRQLEELVAALRVIEPDLAEERVTAWREAATVAALELEESNYRGARGQLYLSYQDGGLDAAWEFVDAFEGTAPTLLHDQNLVRELRIFRDQALLELAGRQGAELELELRESAPVRDVLIRTLGTRLVLEDATVGFDELSAVEQLRWAEGSFHPLMLWGLCAPLQARAMLGDAPAAEVEDWVRMCVEAEAARLWTEARISRDVVVRRRLMARLDEFRETPTFLEPGVAAEVEQALKWLALQAASLPEPEPVVEVPEAAVDPEPVVDPEPEEAEPAVEPELDPLAILEEALHGQVEALEEEGRFAVTYLFEGDKPLEDWDLVTPPGHDRINRLHWHFDLGAELERAKSWEVLPAGKDALLFVKDWKRLQWKPFPVSGALVIQVDMQGLDGHNLSVGLAEGARTLWGVQGFQLPPLVGGDPGNKALQAFFDNFREHNQECRNSLVWETNYSWEQLDEDTKKLPEAQEVRSLALVYEPAEDPEEPAEVRLEDRRRSRARTQVEAEIEPLQRPRIVLGTFGSYVAYNSVRIEFGIDEAGLRQLQNPAAAPRPPFPPRR